jgi:hypothetical protein
LELCLNREEKKTSRIKCIASLEPPPDANKRANQKYHFRVRAVMETNARGHFKRLKYVVREDALVPGICPVPRIESRGCFWMQTMIDR